MWLSFDPQAGHEQVGRRPALVLSPESYNRKMGLGIFCPISSRQKGFSFEVRIPDGLKVSGVVLSDQARNMDWVARRARFHCTIPSSTLWDVLYKLNTLVSTDPS